MLSLQIFVASPGDVGEERKLAARVIERLRYEWAGRVALDAIFWEHEPLRASAGFQEELPRPSEADIAVFILWSRLGTRLHDALQRADGTTYASGTEFEIEDALRGFRERGRPDILVYRKTAKPVTDLTDHDRALENLRQKQALDELVQKTFRDNQGAFVGAIHEFPGASVFETRLEDHLRKLISRRAKEAGLATDAPPPLWQQGSPFRGLASFEPEHAPIFFGRTDEVAQVLEALRRQAALGRPFVLVTGTSGSGKSSLVKAGVLPSLVSPGVIEGVGLWRCATVDFATADERDPCKVLAKALADPQALPEIVSEVDSDELGRQLAEQPESVVPLLRSAMFLTACRAQQEEGLEREPQARLALVLDHLDDLWTAAALADDDLHRLGHALSVLAAGGTVWTLGTLRDDLIPRFREIPTFKRLTDGPGQYRLEAPSAQALGRIVRQPARIAGLRFEEDTVRGLRLDDLLRDAAAADPRALPLLEFTLEELYQRRTEDGLLTLAAYEELGGVEGSLAKHAEAAFQALPRSAQEALGHVLTFLVEFRQETEEPATRRWALEQELTSHPHARALIDSFAERGLLVRRLSTDGQIRLGVVHAALFRMWPRARDWIDQNREALALRTRLRSRADLWQEAGRSEDALLPSGPLLEAAAELMESSGSELGGLEGELVKHSLVAEEERRKRRWLGRMAILAAGLALIACVFIGWWLYGRPHVTFYESFVNRHGMLEGVGPLSLDTVKRRQSSMRVTRRGRLGPVVLAEAVGGDLQPTPYNMLQETFVSYDPVIDLPEKHCMTQFKHGEDGRLNRETAYNCFGDVLWRLAHQITNSQGEQTQVYVNESGIPSDRTRTGIAIVKVRRDADGRDLEHRFLDRGGDPRPDERNAFGYRYEALDELGRFTRQVTLDSELHPALGIDGCAIHELRFDESNRLAAVSCHDPDGRRKLSSYGAARFDYHYDSAGNLKTMTLLDEELQERELASVNWVYDDQGRIIAEQYRGPSEELVFNFLGFASLERSYPALEDVVEKSKANSLGSADAPAARVVREAYFDTEDQPTPAHNGCEIVQTVYDTKGRVIELQCLNSELKLTADAEGKARWVGKYWDQDRKLTESFLGPDEKPINVARGYARVARLFDDRGREIETSFFDDRQQPVCGIPQSPLGADSFESTGAFFTQNKLLEAQGLRRFARRIFERDGRGNVERSQFLDSLGESIPGTQVSETRAVFGSAGETLSVSFLNRSGQLTSDVENSYAHSINEYNKRGQLIAEKRFNTEENLVETENTKYDDQGRPIERWYTDSAGHLGDGARGHARVTFNKDARGFALETAFFRADGGPPNQGCAVISRRWDFFGNLQREDCLNADRQPTPNPQGIGSILYDYDSRHRLRETHYQNVWGKSVVHPNEGYAIKEISRDRWGRPVEERYFVGPGRLRSTTYAHLKTEYDALGRALKLAYSDAQDHLVHGELGCASIVAENNSLGDITGITCFDVHGREAMGRFGFSRAEIRRDTCGTALEVKFLDPAGQKILLAQLTNPNFNPLNPAAWQRLVQGSDEPEPPPPPPPPPPVGPEGPTVTPIDRPPPPQDPPPPPPSIESTLSSLVRKSDQIQDVYENFLDRTDRDTNHEEERLEELLEEMSDLADDARSAYRRAIGKSKGFRDWIGVGSKDGARDKYERKVREMKDVAASIDRLATKYPLGPETTKLWDEMRSLVGRL